MIIDKFSPESFYWDKIPSDKTNGETGFAITRAKAIGAIKIRQVEYSANYLADHWCEKGHIIFVVNGELIIEHKDQSKHTLNSGMTYMVGDDSMPHRAMTTSGATLLIVD